jgi:hypothetical protein
MTRLIDSTPAVAVVLTQGAWIFIFELVSVGGGSFSVPFIFYLDVLICRFSSTQSVDNSMAY